VRNNYQRKERKSNHKFEVVRGQELMVRVPLPMAEVWAEPNRVRWRRSSWLERFKWRKVKCSDSKDLLEFAL